MAPSDGTEPDQLLKNADLALYRAKSEGRGTYRFFEPEMDAHMQARCKLELDLRKALANGEFELLLPAASSTSSATRSAASRRCCAGAIPERGMVSPAEFIPLAEETGLIVPIGEWVLRSACAEAATWPGDMKIAVNLSAVQFQQPHIWSRRSSRRSPHRACRPAPARARDHRNRCCCRTTRRRWPRCISLRALGVRIALDDFGTGYSSLSYLRSFPFDKIKIDRCFVADLSDAVEGSRAILRAVAGLGTSLGIATTAEGVETKEQMERVRAEGCTEMQGYFFSPPRPIKELAHLLGARGEQSVHAA